MSYRSVKSAQYDTALDSREHDQCDSTLSNDVEVTAENVIGRKKPSFDDSAYGSYSTPAQNIDGFDHARRSFAIENARTTVEAINVLDLVSSKEDKPVSWSSLPRKDQLFILTLARLAEPVVQTSLGAYMFFMLKSFDPELSDANISARAGILTASFTFMQCLTAVIWGTLADKEWMGRKNVLIIGLAGTLVSCLGFGFSRSFYAAVFFRGFGGALNGNVGVMRTMISEIIKEKKYQPKAFLMMPITYNVGVLIGPLMGGWLQDPVHTFPRIFGSHTKLGGSDGVHWMRVFPYALPNLLSAGFLFVSVILVILGLEETHVDRRHRTDYGIRLRQTLTRVLRSLRCRRKSHEYSNVTQIDPNDVELDQSPTGNLEQKLHGKRRPQLPYRRIFTRNVLATFATHGMLAGHLGAFGNLWFLFLSTPRFDPAQSRQSEHNPRHLPFAFTGGLGLPPPTIGAAIGILGAFGLCMQFGVYSRVTHKFGVVTVYRFALLVFPLAYTITPYLAVLPTKSVPPHAADGPWVWLGISSLLFMVVTGRTFSLPCTQILVNNCTPHPSVLSTIHGIGQSVSAGARTLGPVVWSMLYGWGLNKGIVGIAYWLLAIEALMAFMVSFSLHEGTGHELRLEGDP